MEENAEKVSVERTPHYAPPSFEVIELGCEITSYAPSDAEPPLF
jgi:hypothetical protein